MPEAEMQSENERRYVRFGNLRRIAFRVNCFTVSSFFLSCFVERFLLIFHEIRMLRETKGFLGEICRWYLREVPRLLCTCALLCY